MGTLHYQTLRENVVSEIRRRILDGELKPGERIVEQTLSQDLGVSRGPIREALRQLEQEELVEYIRNAGCTVRQFSPADIYEIYMLRTSYECVAVVHFLGRFQEEDFAQFQAVLDRMDSLAEGDLPGLVSLDHAFHHILIQRANLPRLTKLWEGLNYGTLQVGLNSGPYRENLARRQHTIHQSLLESFHTHNGDVDAICHSLFAHYVLPVQKVIQESGLDIGDFPIFEHFTRHSAPQPDPSTSS